MNPQENCAVLSRIGKRLGGVAIGYALALFVQRSLESGGDPVIDCTDTVLSVDLVQAFINESEERSVEWWRVGIIPSATKPECPLFALTQIRSQQECAS